MWVQTQYPSCKMSIFYYGEAGKKIPAKGDSSLHALEDIKCPLCPGQLKRPKLLQLLWIQAPNCISCLLNRYQVESEGGRPLSNTLKDQRVNMPVELCT